LTAQHVKLAPWPSSGLPSGVLKAVKDAEELVARTNIEAGEIILESKLAPPGQGGLMPLLIPPGKRAVSIKVDEAIQKSGFVLPNSRVDVLVTMSPGGGAPKESRIVLQDVLVLAADKTVEMKDNKPVTMTTVTMAISPEETERLALAQNEGKVTLALRNLKDDKLVSTKGITTSQLLGSPASGSSASGASKAGDGSARTGGSGVRRASSSAWKPLATPPSSAQTHVVSVIRGTTASEYKFVLDNQKGWVLVAMAKEGQPK
jgi:pilus assembly protein CpaB